MVLKLYMFFESPPARAVLLTAKALGLELLYKMVNLRKGEHLEGELLQLNPQHTIPTLDDNGVIIWDSHAINPYLVRKYAKNDLLYPKDFVKRAVVDQRLHFDSGMFHPILRKVMKSANKYGIKPVVTENIKEALKEAYHFLERFLQRSRWVAGDNITIADFCLIASVTTADVVAPINSFTYPKISFWIKNAQALPYYCEANQVGLDSLRKSFEQ